MAQLLRLTLVASCATIMGMTNPITKYRSDNSLSLEALGDKFGVNKTTVMRWEDGQVPAERAVEIEAVTGIPRAKLRPDLFGAAQ